MYKLKSIKILKTFAVLFFAMLSLQQVQAEESGFFGNIFSPGQLSEAHNYIDSNCEACHSLNKGVENKNCLTCHKTIASDLKEKKGFHGRYKKKQCQSCHTDHKGKDKNIIKIKQVNHDEVDFPLEGKHQRLKCEKCHSDEFRSAKSKRERIDKRLRQGKTYRGLSKDCESCHKKNHGKQFQGQSCTDCHSDFDWTLTQFNHQKDSDFPLVGRHKKQLCSNCHFKKTKKQKFVPFAGLSHKCSSCHKDPHKAKKGNKCVMCHKESSWSSIKPQSKKHKNFNHNKTSFPLGNLHGSIKCEACHPNEKWKLPAKKTCAECHSDVKKIMQGKFIGYHGTKMDIDPMYKTVKCTDCHDPKKEKLLFTDLRKACVDCHNEAFGELWDYRAKKFGKPKLNLTPAQKKERLKKTHRFSDEFEKTE